MATLLPFQFGLGNYVKWENHCISSFFVIDNHGKKVECQNFEFKISRAGQHFVSVSSAFQIKRLIV